MRRYTLVLLAALATLKPALANPGSDHCERELVLTDLRLRQTLDRLTASRSSPMPQRCAVFRDHVRVMNGAAQIFGQCLQGHARGENVAQMQGSIADFREIMARNCR